MEWTIVEDSTSAVLGYECLMAEPDYHGRHWKARLSVNFAIDRYMVSAGYAISDLDYYSGRRNVTLANGSKFHVPDKELSQSIFLALGFSF